MKSERVCPSTISRADIDKLETKWLEEMQHGPEGFQLMGVLLFDSLRYQSDAELSPDQSHKRSFVRSVFAFIDASAYVLKQLALSNHERNNMLYSAAELSMLRDESYNVSDKGRAETQQKFIPTESNFRFALNMVMRCTKSDFDLDTDSEGWRAFKSALKVRHRITHPKQFASLTITADEFRTTAAALSWAFAILMNCGVLLGLQYALEQDKLRQLASSPEYMAFNLIISMRSVPFDRSPPKVLSEEQKKVIERHQADADTMRKAFEVLDSLVPKTLAGNNKAPC